MDIMTELEEALAGDEPDYSVKPEAGTLVLDSDQATQWLSRLDSVRRKRQEIKDARAAAIARLDKVTVPRVANLDEQEAWLEEALTIFHEIMLAADPEGAKTIVLPTGTLKSGTWGGDIWTWDESVFDAWAMENLPGAVEYPAPKILRAEAKKLIKAATVRVSDDKVVLADASTVPGLTVTERERSFKAVTENE